jgi:lipoprotein-anchoring transpeptidase ErfK/SrfK
MKRRVFFTAVSAAVLFLVSGCANLRLANSKFILPQACVDTCQRLHITPTKYVLTVNVAKQSATLFEDGWFVRTFPCSTSRYGIGEVKNSYRTPRGLHRIAEKIGDGESAGTIFRNRQVVGHVDQLGIKAGGITTRIMWLDGLEPGFNQGGNVDTHDREIYIHGTGDQPSLGRPASIGCVHLADPDLIALYDLLPSGTLVWIAEK